MKIPRVISKMLYIAVPPTVMKEHRVEIEKSFSEDRYPIDVTMSLVHRYGKYTSLEAFAWNGGLYYEFRPDQFISVEMKELLDKKGLYARFLIDEEVVHLRWIYCEFTDFIGENNIYNQLQKELEEGYIWMFTGKLFKPRQL